MFPDKSMQKEGTSVDCSESEQAVAEITTLVIINKMYRSSV